MMRNQKYKDMYLEYCQGRIKKGKKTVSFSEFLNTVLPVMEEIERVRKETRQALKEAVNAVSEFIEDGKEVGKSILMAYYFQVLSSGIIKKSGEVYKEETSLELDIPDMPDIPDIPKSREGLEIPENIEIEPEAAKTKVQEIKPEEIEQEMKEIEAEGGSSTGTEILEGAGAAEVLEKEKAEGAEEVVTEAEKLLETGVEIVEETVEIVNGENEIEYKVALDSLNDNNKHHILQEKHSWNKVVDNPNSWDEVSDVLNQVLKYGIETPYGNTKNVFQKIYNINGSDVLVKYLNVNGKLTISDDWVVTR